MVSFAAVRRSASYAAFAIALTWPGLMLAGAPTPGDEDVPQAGPPPNYECSAEALTGSGPGFSSSRDASEAAAREDWLKKATAVYAEATWETANQAGISCVVQGLYSKCFASGIPCRPKAGGGTEESAAPANPDAPDAAAEGPQEETPKAE
jgi:hypothetical protein